MALILNMIILIRLLILCHVSLVLSKLNLKHITTTNNVKAFKKLLKTHTNVMVIYSKEDKSAVSSIKWIETVAREIKGKGTIVYINCGENKDSKKLCKKYSVSPKPLLLKHYKDGSFNKDYDRKAVQKSLLNFMMDPTGEAPWEEDTAANDVVHVNTEKDLIRLRRKEKGPLLMMFYAPWCGYCKKLKPEYASAATEMKGQAILAGMDVDRPEGANVRYQFNITGFPTLVYFENGDEKYRYGGKYNKEGLIDWMKDPRPPAEGPPEEEEKWSDTPSDVVHLTADSFDSLLYSNTSMMVMFYAPWCGHCKAMKPEFMEASKTLKDEQVDGVLAAADCTKEVALCKRYDVKGYPTVKFFKDGVDKYKLSVRTADKIVEFMKDPKEPPPPPPPEQPWIQTSGENVLHLTDATFKESMKKRKHVFVMFYAPWCGHCKKAKPEIEKAANTFADDRKVTFAGIDCTESKEACEKYGVTGYPTFRYFNYGKNDFKYPGGRESQDFINFMKDPKEPPPPPPPEAEWKDLPSKVNHLTDGNFDDFVNQHKSVLVMFYAPWCGHCKTMKPIFTEAAEEMEQIEGLGVLAAVDCTKETKLGSKFEVKGYPTIKYFRDGKEDMKYQESRTKDAIIKFMKNPQKKAPPPPQTEWSTEVNDVKHLTTGEFESFAKDKEDLLVMFYAPWCGHCQKMKPAYTEAAKILKQQKPKAVMAAVDCTKERGLGEKFGIKGYPTVKFFRNGEEMMKYENERTTDGFVEFMLNAKVKKPTPPPPKPWSTETEDVKFLTSDDFVDFSKDKEDLLVMFYAPWCGHCNSMKPAYFEAATTLKDKMPKAVLAAVDCTKERDLVAKFSIKGYPTVTFFRNGEKMLEYESARTVDGIVEFMLGPKVKKAPPPPPKDWQTESKDVTFLTSEDFDAFSKDKEDLLILFYAPWCGHCQSMKFAYFEAATTLKERMPKAALGAVDCTKQKALAERFSIRGYPTVKYFSNGQEQFDYEEGRSTNEIISFMQRRDKFDSRTADIDKAKWKDLPSSVVHLTPDNIWTSLTTKHNLIMYHESGCKRCLGERADFMRAASRLSAKKQYTLAAFDCSDSKDFCKKLGVIAYPTTKFYYKTRFIEDFTEQRSPEAYIEYLESKPLRDEL